MGLNEVNKLEHVWLSLNIYNKIPNQISFNSNSYKPFICVILTSLVTLFSYGISRDVVQETNCCIVDGSGLIPVDRNFLNRGCFLEMSMSLQFIFYTHIFVGRRSKFKKLFVYEVMDILHKNSTANSNTSIKQNPIEKYAKKNLFTFFLLE